MGALDCVTVDGRLSPTSDSKEVFAISNSSLNIKGRDLESQLSKPSVSTNRNVWWTVGTDVPLVILCGLLIGLFELGMIPSHKAGFFCNDPSLTFTFTGDTVSMSALMISVLFLPILVIIITEAIFIDADFLASSRIYQAGRNTLRLYRDYLYGFFFNLTLVEVIKGITGMPRPTFFDICKPSTLKTCNGSEFVTEYECSPSEKFSSWFQSDAAHSFPSGHASLSVYCGLFLMWYLQRRAFSWHHQSVFTVPVLQMALLTYSAYCSLTRITDHRHHWWDVLAGTFIGILSALYSITVIGKNFSNFKQQGTINSYVQQRTLLFDGQRM